MNGNFQIFPAFAATVMLAGECLAQAAAPENNYNIISLQTPADVSLEIGGMDLYKENGLAVCTRRGDVYLIENPYAADGANIRVTPLASGMHEPLGLLADGSDILCVQRGELTRLHPDPKTQTLQFQTVCDAWSISGNYHEYAYGPKRDKNGDLWITLNLSWTDAGRSLVPFRGWAVKINNKGEMIPVCAGLRSPAGLGMNSAGDMFYTDNQGDWNGVCSLRHMERGDFMGHPESLKWWDLAKFDPPINKPPQPPAATKSMYDVAKEMPELRLKLPAVWFPYPRMGQSSSDILSDETGGKFGPFQHQLFVGDQTTSEILRVYLEKVNGKYQGAAFPFRQGFSCGIVRMCWGNDGSMFIGETNRGWGSRGSREFGIERLVWNGKVPFEVLEMRAAADGFDVIFTKPVDRATAMPASFAGTSFTYYYHERYGSEEIRTEKLNLVPGAVSADGKSIHLKVTNLRPGYVYEVHFDGLRSAEGAPLAHPVAYYTLNEIPPAPAK